MSDILPPSLLNSTHLSLPPHFWSWIVLIVGIFGLIYAAKVIAQEKKQFHQDGKWLNWNNFEFFVPAWWTQNKEMFDSLYFYRSDTSYDWYFQIEIIPSSTSTLHAKDSYLNSQKIELDPEVVITTEKNYVLKNVTTLSKVSSFLRIESTATQKEEERIYLDATWIYFENGDMLQLISKSSVLNGGIEGPYVEEVIKGIKLRN